ncbi:hypothetical protein [Streptomyces sp. BK239]|uniref:hypothetical protein n=1 Tax=Streptomyces sp. BK239 TaxID=2512155 RepID=UPI0010E0A2B7|nr:hypothetical protein [Streptomyces sp. BK239]RZU21761.1 hypothetical protein EV567_2266 [Streptomyces sp. BK239]
MRDLIALLAHWLRVLLGHTPPSGRHSAAHLSTRTPSRSTPRRPLDVRSLPPHVAERFRPLDAEQVALVRPYLIAHEKERERRLQRERRTAAVLAELGIDYDVAAVAV